MSLPNPDTAAMRTSRALAQTSSGSWRLTPLKLSNGETRMAISGTPLRSELQEALARYERAAKPADLSALLKALAVLAAMTVRQDNAEHGAVVEATRVYAETLSRFPGDIALSVVKGWPARDNGKWWPTLHDLIAACQEENAERIAAQDALRGALREARPGDDGAGPEPVGATRRFYDRVSAARGPAYAYSWLNRRNCRFTQSTVLTTNFAAQRLYQDVGAIADECGVEIMEGAKYATDSEHGDAEPAPVRRIVPPTDDEVIGDEERAEMAAALRAMAAAMRKGGAA